MGQSRHGGAARRGTARRGAALSRLGSAWRSVVREGALMSEEALVSGKVRG